MNQQNIKVIRSKKRKKTIELKSINNELRIYFPYGLTDEEEKDWIEKMVAKREQKKKKQQLNSNGLLFNRARELNKQYFGGKLMFDIQYVTNQNSRFGSCTPKKSAIRISDRIASMPRWVRDYVIIHEIAHLLYPNHSKKFWEKVSEYTYTERAKGYLIAVGMAKNED